MSTDLVGTLPGEFNLPSHRWRRTMAWAYVARWPFWLSYVHFCLLMSSSPTTRLVLWFNVLSTLPLSALACSFVVNVSLRFSPSSFWIGASIVCETIALLVNLGQVAMRAVIDFVRCTDPLAACALYPERQLAITFLISVSILTLLHLLGLVAAACVHYNVKRERKMRHRQTRSSPENGNPLAAQNGSSTYDASLNSSLTQRANGSAAQQQQQQQQLINHGTMVVPQPVSGAVFPANLYDG
jgi:hypothetical protein